MAPVASGASADETPETGGYEMRDMLTKLYLLTQRDSGQTMAEYAVVLAVIAISVVVALGILSGSISGALDTVTAEL
jgi:Flp pilus assembly pilin Flp